MDTNRFLGKWTLLPEKSVYAQGLPPQHASYEISGGENELLHIHIHWKDTLGKEAEVQYSIYADGQKRVYENPEIADEVMAEFESEQVLNSYTYKAGKTIAFASRILEATGELKIIQRFFPPDGESFENIQYYQKKDRSDELGTA